MRFGDNICIGMHCAFSVSNRTIVANDADRQFSDEEITAIRKPFVDDHDYVRDKIRD